RLEYDFLVAPGADPGRIRLAVDGSASLSLTRTGDLEIHAGGSGFSMRKPVVYQGARQPVEGAFRMHSHGQARFAIGAYDRNRPLVVDPVVSFSSYYGGEKDDSVVALTFVGDIVGVTSSLAFGN